MLTNLLTKMKDFFHAQLCYQFFITPLPLPLEKEYRDTASRACEFMKESRTQVIVGTLPRHYIVHHFAQLDNPHALKVLITHGWMSRAAYMVKLIRCLHQQGYDVYALDFPAHGEAQGLRLTCHDSMLVLRETLNTLGPFYGVVGHSFGGAMLLNTLNFANQLPEWQLTTLPERVVLLSSPTHMRALIGRLARRFKLSKQGTLFLRSAIRDRQPINYLNFQHFKTHGQIPILCIHGKDDITISPQESISFCRSYPHASLALLPDSDHVSVLFDERVGHIVHNFFSM